jgi:26S proteasome regulatory subunit N2
VATAVLSTTAKAKARAKKSEKDKGDSMDIDEPVKDDETKTPKEDDTTKDDQQRKSKKKKEETYGVLENLSRVVPAQLKRITFKDDCRYVPIKKGVISGIALMEDRRPNEEEELIEPSAPTSGK